MESNILNKAIDFHKKNHLKKAIKLYKTILEKKSDNKIIFLLGTALFQNNQYLDSVTIFQKLIKLDPSNYNAHANLAQVQSKLKLIDEAICSYKEAILINPRFSHGYNNLGNLYLSIGKIYEALENFNSAIQIEGNDEFYFNRSRCFEKLGKHSKALKDINIFLNKNPDNFNAHKIKINQLLNLKLFSECFDFLQLIENNCQKNFIYETYIKIFIDTYKFKNAERYIDKLSNQNKKNFYLSTLFYKKGLLNEALDQLDRISPTEYTSNILNNYGLIYKGLGNEDKALSYFEKALKLNPQNNFSRLNIGLIQLKNYDFKNGWENYFYRNKPHYNFLTKLKEYQGNLLPTDNTLILSEQGIGDQILFLNSLTNIKRSNFVFLIDKRLFNFYSLNFPKIKFIFDHKNLDSLSLKYYLFIGDLMKFFFKSKNDLINIKYLSCNINNNFIFNNKINIGISWKSPKSNFEISEAKSLKLIDFVEHLPFDKYHFINIQYGDIATEIKSLEDKYSINLTLPDIDLFDDLENLLNLINQLDLVITTSNITAHLAGIIGKKTFLLIPKNHSRIWYWHNESNSCWYRNTRIFFYSIDKLKETFEHINIELASCIKK